MTGAYEQTGAHDHRLAGESGQRAVPYLCPFCGEQDLRPADGPDAQPRWHCRSCLRLFSLTFHGLAGPQASTVPPHRAPERSDQDQ